MRRNSVAVTRRLATPLLALSLGLVACQAPPQSTPDTGAVHTRLPREPQMIYQLQGYADDALDRLVAAPHDVVVIDLARDGGEDYFDPDEIARLRASSKTVLAYFEIGAVEQFRPEFDHLATEHPELLLGEVPSWPGERFVRFWDPRWWDEVVRPRVDRALATGFDGVYLDLLLAYEQIDPSALPDGGREEAARRMVELVRRIADHAHAQRPGFLVFPQNAPELRMVDGYLDAIDGIGVEDLFFRDTDQPCVADYCAENLDHVRALRDAGKTVLAVDYAVEPDNVVEACRRHREERFGGTVTTVELDTVADPCP